MACYFKKAKHMSTVLAMGRFSENVQYVHYYSDSTYIQNSQVSLQYFIS